MKFRASVEAVDVTSADGAREKDPLMSMIMCLLHSRTNTHIMHWTTRSYATHMALGDYYETIGDLLDPFVESFQGKYGILYGFFEDYKIAQDPVEYLKYLAAEVETLRRKDRFPTDSELQNQVDAIADLIDSTMYKLKFLS